MVCAYACNGLKKIFQKRVPKRALRDTSTSDVESVEPTKVWKKHSKKASKKQANTKPSPTASPDESIPEKALWDFNFYMEQGTIFKGQCPCKRLVMGRICICNFDVLLK